MITKWAQAHRRTHAIICAWCGKTVTRVVRKTRDAGVCCSRACGFAYRDQKRAVRKAERVQSERVECARRKAERAARRGITKPRPLDTCQTCGRDIIRKTRPRRWCSTACRKKSGDWKRMRCCSRRNGKHLRRARQAGVRSERVRVMDVFSRDRWRCQLCGCSTPERLRGRNSGRSPELDHIVPLAAGGSHTWDNVQCACRRCNGIKSAKPLGQLRLSLYVS